MISQRMSAVFTAVTFSLTKTSWPRICQRGFPVTSLPRKMTLSVSIIDYRQSCRCMGQQAG
jgi:hypothetical protein